MSRRVIGLDNCPAEYDRIACASVIPFNVFDRLHKDDLGIEFPDEC